jgi:hypothetical protein
MKKGPPHSRYDKDSFTPKVGFEPTAYRLTADCSTTELFRKDINKYIYNVQDEGNYSGALKILSV